MTEATVKAGMVVVRLLYLTWLGVLSYWFSLPALDWFAREPDALGPHHVVSFNLHPFFMSLAVICLMTEGVLAYRSVRLYSTQQTAKLVHACCMGCSVLFMFAGLAVIFVNHRKKGFKHLYSAHSWMGISVAGFFVLQGLQGMLVFLGVGGGSITSSVRRAVLPVHRAVGVTLYYIALLTVCLGLQEKAGFLAGSAQCSGHPYCKEVMLCNVLVALTVAVGATVALLLSPSDADLTRSADTDYMSIH